MLGIKCRIVLTSDFNRWHPLFYVRASLPPLFGRGFSEELYAESASLFSNENYSKG